MSRIFRKCPRISPSVPKSSENVPIRSKMSLKDSKMSRFRDGIMAQNMIRPATGARRGFRPGTLERHSNNFVWSSPSPTPAPKLAPIWRVCRASRVLCFGTPRLTIFLPLLSRTPYLLGSFCVIFFLAPFIVCLVLLLP